MVILRYQNKVSKTKKGKYNIVPNLKRDNTKIKKYIKETTVNPLYTSSCVMPGGLAVKRRATTESPPVRSPVQAVILAYLFTQQILR